MSSSNNLSRERTPFLLNIDFQLYFWKYHLENTDLFDNEIMIACMMGNVKLVQILLQSGKYCPTELIRQKPVNILMICGSLLDPDIACEMAHIFMNAEKIQCDARCEEEQEFSEEIVQEMWEQLENEKENKKIDLVQFIRDKKTKIKND